jgi:hypothetical protein
VLFSKVLSHQREECNLQSDNHIFLYNQLSDIALKIEQGLKSDDFTEFKVLATSHNDVMQKIKESGLLNDKNLIPAIQEAETNVKNAIIAIKLKQEEIIKQLSSSNKKQLLNKAYNM